MIIKLEKQSTAKKNFPVIYYKTLTDFLLGRKNGMTINVKKFASFEKNAKIRGVEILKKIPLQLETIQ